MVSLFNKRQSNKNKMTAMKKGQAVGWEYSEFIPEGFILKLILAGMTFNSFLLDGISKHFFSLSVFSLIPNILVKTFPANIIQSVH